MFYLLLQLAASDIDFCYQNFHFQFVVVTDYKLCNLK